MLSRLVYYSRNLLSRRQISADGQLRDILRVCRTNNAGFGITGALLFDPHYFAQVLEGERSRVSHLFCRICRDARHEAVTIVEAKSIAERKFSSWSMGLVRTDDTSGMRLDPARVDGDYLADKLAALLHKQNDIINIHVPAAGLPERE
jgi:hypothetical protein